MSERCPLPPRSEDDLAPAEVAAWRGHLDRCVACATAWLRDEPSRVFAELAEDPVPVDVLARMTRELAATIDDDEGAGGRRRRRAAWLAGCAAAALAAGLALGIPGGGDPADRTGGASVAVDLRSPAERADVRVQSDGKEVRVVDLTVGDRQVVMIFDRRLRL